ncbi:cell division protein FtsQ/DivIB [Hyphomicrobium sp.]|jgi:cell division protein FtsQ|uniref:cell division protein FtsQ/DivIB n=1 Tax=Hyphomicrobium sp. TaxID=82 RepID=UPI002D009481|nr:FtsQ-type POTRA domain-containing protein [Hyphomicrobium sp.]HVZ03178.1 FtsQ-type POTRA domain-containing protein [Hyphomicrobium sp.]
MQGSWRRARQASRPEPLAVPSLDPYPATRTVSQPALRRHAASLKAQRGERRIRRSRRTLRRWAIYGAVASIITAVAGGASYALYAYHVTLNDIMHAASADADALLIAAGFGINQVNISGQHFASDSDIYDALDLTNVKTFAAFDSEATLKRIERIPWIDKAQMTRIYPGTLDIVVRERKPELIWTRGNESYLVDATGRVLGPMPAVSDWMLPRVVGEGATKDVAPMLAALHQYPAIYSQFSYAERVAERRWRIVLKNGTRFELAADREVEGLQEIANSRAVASALNGAPMIIDVRTPGRIAMRPTDGKSPGAPLTVSSR